MVVLGGVLLLGAAPVAAARNQSTNITIAVVPGDTSVGGLSKVPGMGVGILSAGIGNVPADQTYLDMSQGARVPESLYDRPLPRVSFQAGPRGQPTVRSQKWQRILARARSAPANLVPGLLGAALSGQRRTAAILGPRADAAGLIVAGRGGAVTGRRCLRGCSTVTVRIAGLDQVRRWARRLHGNDLLIAIGRPPPAANHGVALGIAGRGFDGTLSSDSTRMRGFVLDTDLAPTILDRLGIAVPKDMSGEPIHAGGAVDAAYVRDLAGRLAVIGPRRAPVIGVSALAWLIVTVLALLVFRRAGLEVAVTILATSLVLMPAMLLLCAAIEPGELAERLIVGIGCPALAVAVLRLAPGFRGFAIAAGLSVVGYGADAVAGSHLTELSLLGPNPIAGIRFYGIGNELEAAIAALVPMGTGAALAGWAPRGSPRTAAVAFAVTGILAIVVFAPGRFGADVGAAIDLAVGTAVAVGVCTGVRRWRWAWVIVAPIVAVAALVAIDLASGGNAHLTRSVLDAGGLGDLGQVAQRRLDLSAHSFARYAGSPVFWTAVAVIVSGLLGRRAIRGWFGARDVLWAGFVGALAATFAGTLANDSGALLLMIGTAVCAAAAAVAWATQPDRRPPSLWSPGVR